MQNLHAALNTNLPMPYAGGGSTGKKDNDSVLAHFSTPEVHAMTLLQGHHAFDKKTGAHDFTSLGKDLFHPLIHDAFTSHAIRHLASGGGVRQMAHDGRYGDTQVASIPRSLADHLDRIQGGSSINPKDGHREYFNFGGLFGNLASGLGKVMPNVMGAAKKMVPSIASKIAPMASKIMPSAQSAVGAQPGMMGKLGSMLSSGAGKAGNFIKANAPAMLNKGKEIAGAVAPVAMQYGQQYLSNKLDPANATPLDKGQMFHDMTGAAAPSFGEGHARRAFEGARSAGSDFLGGGNMRSAIPAAIHSGTEGMDNMYARGARSAADAYANQGSMRDVASSGARGALSGHDTPAANAGRAALDRFDSGAGLGDSMSTGMKGYGDETGNPYARMAGMAGQAISRRNQPSGPMPSRVPAEYDPRYDEQFAY